MYEYMHVCSIVLFFLTMVLLVQSSILTLPVIPPLSSSPSSSSRSSVPLRAGCLAVEARRQPDSQQACVCSERLSISVVVVVFAAAAAAATFWFVVIIWSVGMTYTGPPAENESPPADIVLTHGLMFVHVYVCVNFSYYCDSFSVLLAFFFSFIDCNAKMASRGPVLCVVYINEILIRPGGRRTVHAKYIYISNINILRMDGWVIGFHACGVGTYAACTLHTMCTLYEFNVQ